MSLNSRERGKNTFDKNVSRQTGRAGIRSRDISGKNRKPDDTKSDASRELAASRYSSVKGRFLPWIECNSREKKRVAAKASCASRLCAPLLREVFKERQDTRRGTDAIFTARWPRRELFLNCLRSVALIGRLCDAESSRGSNVFDASLLVQHIIIIM